MLKTRIMKYQTGCYAKCIFKLNLLNNKHYMQGSVGQRRNQQNIDCATEQRCNDERKL